MVGQPDAITSGWLDLYMAERPQWERQEDGSYKAGNGKKLQCAELFWETGMKHCYFNQYYLSTDSTIAFFRIAVSFENFRAVLDRLGTLDNLQ